MILLQVWMILIQVDIHDPFYVFHLLVGTSRKMVMAIFMQCKAKVRVKVRLGFGSLKSRVTTTMHDSYG